MIDTTAYVRKPKIPFELKQCVDLSEVTVGGMDFEEVVMEALDWATGNGDIVYIPDEYQDIFYAWCESQPGFVPEIDVQVYRSW